MLIAVEAWSKTDVHDLKLLIVFLIIATLVRG